MTTAEDILAHISEKPWSAYTAADYTPNQYKAACLVVRGDGSTKEQCKLPVKTPNGALSRAGVHAAAGAFAGARGGVDLSVEERVAAKKKLAGYYKQLGEEAPPSLSHADLGGGSMTNTTAAIMAIPAPLEPIRLVGDEDKHASLLYFGETSTLPLEALQTLKDSVAMASDILFPCSEDVINVQRLGDEVPPALVAMLTDRCLSQIRNLFKMNPAVNGYLNNSEQFPSFTPHVTLSHPDFADEAIQRVLMKQVGGVRFDRLSIWWNDERFDYDLSPQNRDVNKEWGNLEMAQSISDFLAEYGEDHVEHSGVKGMKWGVRKDGPTDHSVFTSIGGKKPRVGDKFDNAGTSHTVVRSRKSPGGGHIVTTRPTAAIKTERAAAGQKIARIFMKDKEYWKKAAAVAAVGATGLAAAAVAPAVLPAGVLLAAGGPAVLSAKIAFSTAVATRIGYAHNYVQWARRSGAARKLRHDDLNEARTVGKVYDDLTPAKQKAANLLIDAYSRGEEFSDDPEVQTGWAAMTPIERSVVLFIASGKEPPQTSTVVHAVLNEVHEAVTWVEEGDAEQSGIKGMKWGVRRNVDSATGRVEQTGSTGLKPRTGSADQIAADRVSGKIKKGGVESVSNADIQTYVKRVQMQGELNRVLTQQQQAAQHKADGFIKGFVKKQASRQTDRIANAAVDIAIEKALGSAGKKLSDSNPELGSGLLEISSRIKPKKKK